MEGLRSYINDQLQLGLILTSRKKSRVTAGFRFNYLTDQHYHFASLEKFYYESTNFDDGESRTYPSPPDEQILLNTYVLFERKYKHFNLFLLTGYTTDFTKPEYIVNLNNDYFNPLTMSTGISIKFNPLRKK